MNKVLKYFNELIKEKPFKKDITVYGWKFNYDYKLVSSVTPYLFEDLNIIENIASPTNENRDGRIKEKKYIVIHDTGETTSHTDAHFWSEVVKCEKYEDNQYKASFQYVVGTDGIYHNIPDNEVAYHAGDTTYFDYKLYDTLIPVEDRCDISIKDGFYYINDIFTNIACPKVDGVILTKDDINENGILCINKNGTYHIGETYFNNTYKKIANRGGNNNGIGMEVCVNEGADIYLNWQRSAKLAVKLLNDFNLTIDDIKPHHYFSGKNCPQTLRENKLWDNFINMVKVEFDIYNFIKEGYTIKLIPISNNVLENGRITDITKLIKFKIITKFQDIEEEYEYIV